MIKLILRRLFRERIYSVINIVGLVMAFTVVLLLYSHVAKEFRMDKYHRNSKNMYRMILGEERGGKWFVYSTEPTAPAAKEEIPGIKDYTRILSGGEYYVKTSENGDFVPGISCLTADFSFFRLFTVPIVSGMVKESGNGNDLVISQKMARRYFGDKDPVGRQVVTKCYSCGGKGDVYTVVAVMEDFPAASTIQADMIMRFHSEQPHWGAHGVYSFFLLDPKADIAMIEKAIPEMIERHYPPIKASENKVKLQPLEDIYFSSGVVEDSFLRGDRNQALTLCGVGLLILLLASCNYVLIRIARLNRKLGEFAVQRCYGAVNRVLLQQLFLETGVFALCGLLPAFLFAYWLHPYYLNIISAGHVYPVQLTFPELAVFVLIVVGWTAAVGGILYTYIARKLDREGIKNSIGTDSRGFDLKKVLTLVQMVIFSALIFSAIVFTGQIDYLKNKPLGFDNRNTVDFGWRDTAYRFEELQERLLRNPAILGVSVGDFLPFEDDGYEQKLELNIPGLPDKKVETHLITGDASYIDTYLIRLIAGRNIDRESYSRNPEDFFKFRPEHSREILVNKKFVEQMGLSEPVGMVVSDDYLKFKIVGVVDDFHFNSFAKSIRPVMIVYDMPALTSSLVVRYHPDRKREAVDYIGKVFKERFPDTFFNYGEYDYTFFYRRDLSFAKMINILTLIAVLIGGMGVFAFSTFMVGVRRKEIGLRKINGATEGEVVRLLGVVFIRRVLLACAVGLPVAYFAMREWLHGYAYRIGVNVWMFLLVVAVSLLLVCLITGWQLWKAARTNPVDSLKNE